MIDLFCSNNTHNYRYFSCSPVPILVLILALTSWVQADENVCNNIENGEFLQHAFDDTKYIMCWDGEPTEKTCFRGLFNPTTKECSRISKNSFECPTETFFADFPVDYECSKFIRCLNGKASTHFCGKDLLFDPIRKQCNHKEFVVCPCPAIDKPDNPLFVRDWTDCAK